jgi:hypothetical protein
MPDPPKSEFGVGVGSNLRSALPIGVGVSAEVFRSWPRREHTDSHVHWFESARG